MGQVWQWLVIGDQSGQSWRGRSGKATTVNSRRLLCSFRGLLKVTYFAQLEFSPKCPVLHTRPYLIFCHVENFYTFKRTKSYILTGKQQFLVSILKILVQTNGVKVLDVEKMTNMRYYYHKETLKGKICQRKAINYKTIINELCRPREASCRTQLVH